MFELSEQLKLEEDLHATFPENSCKDYSSKLINKETSILGKVVSSKKAYVCQNIDRCNKERRKQSGIGFAGYWHKWECDGNGRISRSSYYPPSGSS